MTLYDMAEKLDSKEIVSIEEIAIANMWEIAALVEVLKTKGIITEQEILDTIQELRRKAPKASCSYLRGIPDPFT